MTVMIDMAPTWAEVATVIKALYQEPMTNRNAHKCADDLLQDMAEKLDAINAQAKERTTK